MLKKSKKILAIMLVLSIIASNFSFIDFRAYALDVDDEMKISDISFFKNYNGYNLTGATLRLEGIKLDSSFIRFEMNGGDFVKIEPSDGDEYTLKFEFPLYSSSSLNYDSNFPCVENFSGLIKLKDKTINILENQIPSIDKADKFEIVEGVDTELNLTGANFSEISSTGYSAIYGAGAESAGSSFEGTIESVSGSNKQIYKLSPIKKVGDLGYRNIWFTYKGEVGFVGESNAANPANLTLKSTYNRAFILMEDLQVNNARLVPNSGARGDFIEIHGDNFSGYDTANGGKDLYNVYFLDPAGNGTDLDNYKMSPSVQLSQNGKYLTVQVPTSSEFKLGEKKVVIFRRQNNQNVGRYELDERFNVIDAQYKPSIMSLNPGSGPNTGAVLQIIGTNIIRPSIPGLEVVGVDPKDFKIDESTASNPDGQISNDELELTIKYITNEGDGLKFSGLKVTELKRIIRVNVGQDASFIQNETNNILAKYNMRKNQDELFVLAKQDLNYTQTQPEQDVLVQIETIIKTEGGKEYSIKYRADSPKPYIFLESSLVPEIESLNPDTVQIDTNKKVNKETLIAIEGDNFLVNKYTGEDGKLKTNYPIIQIQDSQHLGVGDYVFKFDPNEVNGGKKGTVRKSDGTLVDAKFKMEVITKDGKKVDGSVGNEIGQRIIIYLPDKLVLPSEGRKNIQVINPTRGEDSPGYSAILKDGIGFQMASDNPVINAVEPNVVTLNSSTEVLVRGKNFLDGVRVFIDGIEVNGVERELDTQGDGMTLKFKSPEGRLGITQLLVLNPGGGMDMRDFYFIKSLGQDPALVAIAPDKGTQDTLVVATGDNFVKPDPSTEANPNPVIQSPAGLDIFRLIGTRVYLDGKDVNLYNRDANNDIQLVEYAKEADNQKLLEINNGRVIYSSYRDNVLLTDMNDKVVFELTTDNDANPIFFDGDKFKYVFKVKKESGTEKIYAYRLTSDENSDEEPVEVGEYNQTGQTIQINGEDKFKIRMDNKIISAKLDENLRLYASLANYHSAVVLYDKINKDYYTLTEELDGSITLSNGRDRVYSVKCLNDAGSTIDNPKLVAENKKNGVEKDINFSSDGNTLTISEASPINLVMTTPYKVENSTEEINSDYVGGKRITGLITGKRAIVKSKDTIHFTVPALNTGSGLKDVMVINPDTKSSELKQSFYYYDLPYTHPVISRIMPNRGSVDGGYLVSIHGRDFNDTTQVYFAGLLVPPTDKYVAPGGNSMEVKVPKYPYDINIKYGVGEIKVPVVVVNSDGASDQVKDGFTYVKPASTPLIKKLVLDNGSANGGEVVEIIGQDFRFFEPYINVGGSAAYEEGTDTFTNMNNHLSVKYKWDNLLTDPRMVSEVDASGNNTGNQVDLWEATKFKANNNYYGYDKYLASPILPSVYFGTRKAKIVEFSTDYLKVITPRNTPGTVDVVVMNNDSGVSNGYKYTYSSSNPSITYINPSTGARVGSEIRNMIGDGFYKKRIDAYQNDDANTIVENIQGLDALIRFGDISNLEAKIGDENDGRINANHATVRLDGGLLVSYDGFAKKLKVSIEEGGELYRREFSNYDGRDIFVPAGMLKNLSKYYKPYGHDYSNDNVYNKDNDYELIRIRVDRGDKRLIVERGYAPKAKLMGEGEIEITTPSYYTIDTVNVYLFNPDGGVANTTYTYTNPASKPKIESAKPMEIIAPNTKDNQTDYEQRMVQASTQGGARIEITGRDFRDGAKVYFGTKEVKVLEVVYDDTMNMQTIIAEVPTATKADENVKYPIIVINKDGGTAMSTDVKTLGTDKRLLYFIYRKPLSLPSITEVVPARTSQFGGNPIEIRGEDIRRDAQVILGSKGGVPVTPNVIDEFGRFVKFNMPTGMSPGPKDVQIVNSDFGTVTLKSGIDVVSYPVPENKITDDEGQAEVNVVSTEGKEVITIKGKNFMDGAKVYFGGKRYESAEAKDSNGVKGFYKDDKYYTLSGAIEAAGVEFIDENTLKVTTPSINKAMEYKITIINPDEGLSPEGIKVTFSLPKPSAPTSLKAKVVDDKYIKLYDYRTDNIKYYTVYAYIGRKKAYELKKDKYRDFKSLDTTNLEPYKIQRLEGAERLGKDDYIHFVLKAVNDYGSSSWSNIATIKYKEFQNLKLPASQAVNSGKNTPTSEHQTADSKNYRVSHSYGVTKLVLNGTPLQEEMRLKVGEGESQNSDMINIIIPKEQIGVSDKLIRLDLPVAYVSVSPAHFDTPKFTNFMANRRGYANFKFTWSENKNSSAAESRLPKTLMAVSPVMKFDLVAQSTKERRDISPMANPFKMAVKLNSPLVTEDRNKPMGLYKYDAANRRWTKVNHEDMGALIRFDVDASAYYVLCQNR